MDGFNEHYGAVDFSYWGSAGGQARYAEGIKIEALINERRGSDIQTGGR